MKSYLKLECFWRDFNTLPNNVGEHKPVVLAETVRRRMMISDPLIVEKI